MTLRFTKMHGLGNDYVYVSLFDQQVTDAPELARRISDRHRGVGSDGLILIAPPAAGEAADARMVMYNADGSRGEMCGNGIRCVGRYLWERGLVRRADLRIATDAGVRELRLALDDRGRVRGVQVNMGRPSVCPRDVPVQLDAPTAVGFELALPAGPSLRATCVSVGNPHAVVFVEDAGAVPLDRWGPLIERHALFPQRVNVHFAQVLSAAATGAAQRVRMRTWERGSGATQACGTGACAVCVAGVLEERTSRQITAELPGGELQIEWNADSGQLFMTGPAELICDGQWLG